MALASCQRASTPSRLAQRGTAGRRERGITLGPATSSPTCGSEIVRGDAVKTEADIDAPGQVEVLQLCVNRGRSAQGKTLKQSSAPTGSYALERNVQ